MAEKENWVWHGADCLKPEYRRCLVQLSRGGADADVVREFDLETKAFVKDGFSLPESKNSVGWLDADRLYVGTDFGPGSMTTSGYRASPGSGSGDPARDGGDDLRARTEDVWAFARRDHMKGFVRDFVCAASPSTRTRCSCDAKGSSSRSTSPTARKPTSTGTCCCSSCGGWTVGGKTYPAGALLAADFEAS